MSDIIFDMTPLSMANKALHKLLPTYFSLQISPHSCHLSLQLILSIYIYNKLMAVIQVHCPFPCLSTFVLQSLCQKCVFIFLLIILAQLHHLCEAFLGSPSKVNHSFLFSQSTLYSKSPLQYKFTLYYVCVFE